MAKYDATERSLLNASPETKDESFFSKVPLQISESESPPDYAEDLYRKNSPRKRDRLAFRLDSWADWVWDTSANVLQIKSTGKGWTAETCSYLFAVLSLLGLVATLYAHQNKPLPEWPQLITVNSIVSLFSLLMRAGVGLVLAEGISQCKWQWFRKDRKLNNMERFDAASRSAWGSFALLFHIKPERLSSVAALGALVTILAALTGFFLQQLMVFEDCLQRDPTASARILKTNNCRVSYAGALNLDYDPAPPMIAAINSAMVQLFPDPTSVLSQGCLSGNCTFPSDHGASFSTVAVGHLCETTTEQIHYVGDIRDPSIVVLSTGNNKTIEVCPHCDDLPVVMATGTGHTSYYDSKSLATINFLYTNVVPNGSEKITWDAVKCSLFPTVNTYAVEIKDAVMKETLIKSAQIPSNPLGDKVQTDPFAEYERLAYSHRLIASQTLRDGLWEDCNELTGFNENAFRVFTGPNTTGYYHRDCVYSFSRAAAGGISLYFAELFDDQKLHWSSDIDPDSFYWRYHTLDEHPAPRRKGPPHLRQMYTYGNFRNYTADEIMEGVSSAMTTVVRTHYSDGPETDAKGDMWVVTTCIRIDWRWLSFPMVMIGLTGIFLVLVTIDNRGVERERLWKSSALATLFCEVDHGVEGNAHLASKRAMYDFAKSTSASLDGKGDTLRLVAR